MFTLFKEGGFPMWAVLAFGLTALVTAFAFAVRPSERNIRFIKEMATATILASIAGVAIDFSTTAHYVAEKEMPADQRWLTVLEGFGESMAPAVMGFTMVALVALMMAVGTRRLDARKE